MSLSELGSITPEWAIPANMQGALLLKILSASAGRWKYSHVRYRDPRPRVSMAAVLI